MTLSATRSAPAPAAAPPAARSGRRLRVLLLADECNPEWPSLPIVTWKYAREIAARADVTLVTQVRNRANIERAGHDFPVAYVDSEWIAAPLYRLALRLRGGDQVAWSTSMIMAYLPYLAFEHQAWRMFRARLRAAEFDLVHRLSPMSPTLPSFIAGRLRGVPFVIGPLNGNLPWPRAFAAEQSREREGARRLRDLYKLMPYARSTYDRAAAVLTAFDHTRADLGRVPDDRTVMFPEVGFDPAIFHDRGAAPAGARGGGRLHFLFAGRLVPYKLPELPLRAFAASPALRRHRLTVIGDGPEMPRLAALVAEEGLQDCVTLAGRRSQAEVAAAMRAADVFVFPSIRELGAGVVVEAMASAMHCIVTDYGAPAALCAGGRGTLVPLAPFDTLAAGFRAAMEAAAADPAALARTAAAARDHALALYPWAVKGERTLAIYRAVLAGQSPAPLGYHPA